MREIRLSLLTEIEKRKQAEEALKNMRNVWQTISQQLSLVGLTLPADLAVVGEDGQPDVDIAQELSQQVSIARFVSDSIGRGIAKAQVEMEMEAQIDSKNFEIARLWDRLHYYDAVNREMSQRNQEGLGKISALTFYFFIFLLSNCYFSYLPQTMCLNFLKFLRHALLISVQYNLCLVICLCVCAFIIFALHPGHLE